MLEPLKIKCREFLWPLKDELQVDSGFALFFYIDEKSDSCIHCG